MGPLVVLLASILLTHQAVAKDGRDFTGHYSLTGVSERDGMVRVALTLRLVNYSGQDLRSAAIEVHSAEPGAELLGFLPAIRAWASNRDVVTAGDFNISADEYQRWLGRSPGVFVVYRDSQGAERRAWAQLSRRPLIVKPSDPGRPPASAYGK